MDNGALSCFVPNGACADQAGTAQIFFGVYAHAPWGAIAVGAMSMLAIYGLVNLWRLLDDERGPNPKVEPALIRQHRNTR